MVGTHHIGASTQQAQDAIAAGVVEVIDAFVQGETPNCVNLTPSRIGSATLTVRHLDRVGVLAHVLDRLSRDRLNVEHMQNRVFRGGDAAVATIDVAGPLSDDLLADLVRPARRVRSLGDHHRRHDMTAAPTDGDLASDAVRPFEARVVRQEWAAQAVTPMLDALGGQRPPTRVPAAAYEHSPRAFYVYRMRHGSEDHVGVVADVRLDAFAGGGVRGHESVEPHRVDALVRYYADLPTRSEPVALLHAQRPSTTRRVGSMCRDHPLLHFPGPDGLEHTVWRVTDEEETTDLAADLGDAVHYIADGHHRVAARLLAWERAGRPADAGVLCMLFPMDGLTMSAFHRRVCGPVDAASLIDAASLHFLVRRVPTADLTTEIGLYVAGSWYDLTPTDVRPEGAAGLDASLLHDRLLGPALGICGDGHPRLEVLPDHVPLEQPTARCDEDNGVLFVLRPPSLHRLTRIADRGEQMPPKTTYFTPKPYAGIFA